MVGLSYPDRLRSRCVCLRDPSQMLVLWTLDRTMPSSTEAVWLERCQLGVDHSYAVDQRGYRARLISRNL